MAKKHHTILLLLLKEDGEPVKALLRERPYWNLERDQQDPWWGIWDLSLVARGVVDGPTILRRLGAPTFPRFGGEIHTVEGLKGENSQVTIYTMEISKKDLELLPIAFRPLTQSQIDERSVPVATKYEEAAYGDSEKLMVPRTRKEVLIPRWQLRILRHVLKKHSGS